MKIVTRRHQLRKLYHGAVLTTIARQCPIQMPDSDEYFPEDVAIAAWKEHMRSLFHPGRSSEDLSDDEYYALCLQAEAHGATELGVEFPVKEPECQ